MNAQADDFLDNRFATMQHFLNIICIFAFAFPAIAQQPGNKPKTQKPPSRPSIVWVNEPKPNQLPIPNGVQHLTFHSDLVDQDVGYCIYLPEEYKTNPQKRFPVIYNLHGNGGSEFTGIDSVRVLKDGIRKGRWPAAIMVFPNGGHSTFYKNSADGKFPIESIFITEFIPFIDQDLPNDRVKRRTLH